MDDYEQLLNEAYKKVQPIKEAKDRFEMPKAQIITEGNRTMINNFTLIVSYLRRNPDQFQKFLVKELAVPAQRDGDRLVMTGRVITSKIQEKIDQYVQEYVICKECKKPDTQLIKDAGHKLTIMHCLACGAKHPVRG